MRLQMTDAQFDAVLEVLDEVQEERVERHAQRGQSDLPDGTGPGSHPERGTFRHMLEAKVEAAVTAPNSDTLRAELVEVAAVCVEWIEALDRRSTRRAVRA